METAHVVLGLHLLVGTALAVFGLYTLVALGGVLSGGVNLALGAVVIAVGFRMRDLV